MIGKMLQDTLEIVQKHFSQASLLIYSRSKDWEAKYKNTYLYESSETNVYQKCRTFVLRHVWEILFTNMQNHS